jgi:hypothetical protein
LQGVNGQSTGAIRRKAALGLSCKLNHGKQESAQIYAILFRFDGKETSLKNNSSLLKLERQRERERV